MLDPVPKIRHLLVALAVLATPALVMLGIVGRHQYPQTFEAKQVVVTPTRDHLGVTIREVVDDDFGTSKGHGYERFIPNDFGAPVAVTASSNDSPATLDITDGGTFTRIRIGDPNHEVSGQHRYILTYTLPKAQIEKGTLALDIIGNDETLKTKRFEVVLSGFVLGTPLCNVGAAGTQGGCSLTPDGVLYRTVIAPLEPFTGVTVGGAITKLVEPLLVEAPPVPARRHEQRLPLALATLLIGMLAGGSGYLLATRMGRNEVAGTSAADAAYAPPPTPPTPTGGDPSPAPPPAPTRLVTDRQLEAMSTTEFVPPDGIRPWQGRILLREQIDSDSVSAWFSDPIA
ncbi:MAG: hypothetical protein WCI22_12750, partial [Actinomycetota bacterium]